MAPRAGAIRSKGGSGVFTVSRMTIDPAFEAAPRHLISFSPHLRAPWCEGHGACVCQAIFLKVIYCGVASHLSEFSTLFRSCSTYIGT